MREYRLCNRAWAAICLLYLFIGATSRAEAQLYRYEWKPSYYALIDGTLQLTFFQEQTYAKPTLGDLDHDGDLDLIMGNRYGTFSYFENIGSADRAEFKAVHNAITGIVKKPVDGKMRPAKEILDVGDHSAPALVDIDNDGDLDLVVGNSEGFLWFFRNVGNSLNPEFEQESTDFMGVGKRHGARLTPTFFDVNQDQLIDLIIGNADGRIFLYFNTGSQQEMEVGTKPLLIATLSDGYNATPDLIDWDQDGDMDIISGQRLGTFAYFENTGSLLKPEWIEVNPYFQGIDAGGQSAPTFADLNGDERPDVLIGGVSNKLEYFENRTYLEERVFWNVDENLLKFRKLVVHGAESKVTAGDVDGDGDQDLIIGEKAGNISLYRNNGYDEKGVLQLETISDNLVPTVAMENAAPELGDLNQDGLLDLLVGTSNIGLLYLLNTGQKEFPEWQLQDLPLNERLQEEQVYPRIADMNGDGKADILFGFRQIDEGGDALLQFSNQSTERSTVFGKAEPNYPLESIEGLQKVIPAMFDWNKNGKPTLFMGNEQGELYLINHKNFSQENLITDTTDEVVGSLEDPNASIYVLKNELSPLPYVFNYNRVPNAAPYFVDINGDGDQDLLLGDANGDILLFTQEYSRKLEKDELLRIAYLVNARGDEAVEEELSKQVLNPVFIPTYESILSSLDYSRPVPSFGDIDADGDYDLVVGSHRGKIRLYRNIGSAQERLFEDRFEELPVPSSAVNTAPEFVDLNGDGDLDIIAGTESGRLLYFENKGTKEKPEFHYRSDVFRNFRLGLNAKPSTYRIPNTMELEIISGSITGKLTVLRSNRQAPKIEYVVHSRDFLRFDSGLSSTPTFIDLNNDDIPEMLIGSESGGVMIFQSSKNNSSSSGAGGEEMQWKPRPSYLPKDYTFPMGSFPTAVDLDSDGDKDLVVAVESAGILYFENVAIHPEEGDQ